MANTGRRAAAPEQGSVIRRGVSPWPQPWVIRFRRPDGQLPPSVAGGIRTAGEDVELRVAEATKALHVVTGYVLGHVTMEQGPMIGGGGDDADAEAREQMARLVVSADFPRLRDYLPYLEECDVEEQFEFGLDILIRGIRARVADSTGR